MGAWLLPLMLHLSCCCFFISANSQTNATACSQNDLDSLHGFLRGLSSPVNSWSLNSSACCAWAGVVCGNASSSTGTRVVGLDLFNMSLKGAVSDSLAGLDQLRTLNLSSNSLGGPVPARLFQLPRLEQLDLSMNDLSGSVPSDADLPSIRAFNISGNLFNGSHPVLPGSQNLTSFDVSCNLFTGSIGTSICSSSPGVEVLSFSVNLFTGDFPTGFGNCSFLTELAVDMNMITGELPEDLFKLSAITTLFIQDNQLSGVLSPRIGNLSNLARVDISLNSFSGAIPDVFGSFKHLESFSAQSNEFSGRLPPSLCNMSTIKLLSLRNNSLSGRISLNFGVMASLCSLDLSWNSFSGRVPDEISLSSGLKMLNLGNNNLTGEIPSSLSSLVSLSYLSLSKNDLSNISSALAILQHCPSLTNLVLTKNFLSGENMPFRGIDGFRNLEVLVIPNCGLRGTMPQWLASCSKLMVLDLSWNRLGGPVPSWVGSFDHLFYLDLSNNSLTGGIPGSLTQMKGLVSFDSSFPAAAASIEDFPFFIRRNNSAKGLQYKKVSSFPPSLILCSNMLVGPVPPGFGNLKMLHVLDLSKNRLSGAIPEELSSMSSLETLDLSYNNLTGAIPSSLTHLNFLSNFNVAYNDLVGSIPSGGQFSTFAAASFEGNPGLCNSSSPSACGPGVPVQLVGRWRKNRGVILGMAFGIGLGTALLIGTAYLVVSRSHSKIQEAKDTASANGDHLQSAGSRLVLLFHNKDNKEISIGDILRGTGNFDETNIVGCGGFGLVYRATLCDGRKVAIKRLSGDFGQMEREFQAEIEALSRAQHQNLVLLQGYCRIRNDRLLIYSYMENGSLDYWLHERLEGGSTLDWGTRLRIAQGSARGLAYLHQSCQPHILHRDIKSSNILLDENFEAHLADFGLARLVTPYDTHVTTDLVGTLGYIPPEYGQSSVATFKGDVYSFGVVLLELLTGRRPVDMSKPKCSRDLISWVVQMRKERREAEVFDPFIYDKEHDEPMKKILDIACLCMSDSPKLRPLTHQLVAWLDGISLLDG
ncbi:phytosulfokine receptor 1-like [Iris pallida]|uniref:non-specific serine/threonine protein kinase n=1 Tax=Iris pallida TaxID=29817 RepID=A0AAX6HH95_IRIPA|nr:phytosulfokine receptor 1-like [Iris pallida]